MLHLKNKRQTKSSSSKVQTFLSLHQHSENRINPLGSLHTDRSVWAFRGYDLVAGFPKSISMFGLPKTVEKIDAALYDEESGKILFFVDRVHYRCEQKPTTDTFDDSFEGVADDVTVCYCVQL